MTAIFETSVQSKKTNFEDIPIIDIASLVNGSDIESVAKKLRFACENIGFIYIKNHGVEQKLIDDLFKISKEFFSLPIEEKNKLHIKHSNLTLRAYIGIPSHSAIITYLSTYSMKMIKGYKISLHLIFGRNSFSSIQKRSDLEMLDNVLLALRSRYTITCAKNCFKKA